MTKQNRLAMWTMLMAGVGAAVLPGCASNKGGHEAAVAAHKERYNEIRSGLILNMAQQQFDGGDLDQAEASLKDALAMDPENPKLHTLSGRIALERGQLERAYRLLELAIELDVAQDSKRKTSRKDAAEKSKKASKKEKEEREAPEAGTPRFPEPFYYQGVVLQRWQQFDKAEAAYRQAYELQPDNPSFLMAQAEMLVELGRAADAIELLEAKRTYFDQNAAMRAAIGHLYRMEGEPAKAVPYFEQAALLSPDNPKLPEELALTQLAAGQNDRAAAALERLLREPSRKDRLDLRRALATAYLRTGRNDKAREVYLTIARGPQGSATDWVKLGELALKQKDYPAALNAANRAMAMAPQQHEGFLLAGMALQRRGALEESLRMFDRAAELSPADGAALILRGISLERAGRKTAAAEAYREALRRQPDDARAQRLLSNVQ